MNVISSTNLPIAIGRAGAGLPSIIQRWPGRNSHEILPGLFLSGLSQERRLPSDSCRAWRCSIHHAVHGDGIAFHNIVGTAAWAKQRNIQSPPAARYRHSPIRLSIDVKPARHLCDDKDVFLCNRLCIRIGCDAR